MTSIKSKSAKPTTKSKKTAAPVGVPTAVQKPSTKSRVRVGEKDFIARLTERVTHFDATMILEAAMLTAGVDRQDGHFKKDETREICLALIKRGGPAFAVGTHIYREVVG